MKNVFVTLILACLAFATWAQSPQSFKYQAIARDANGDVYANQAIGMQISILQTSATGTNVYTETHTVTSNAFGLINLEIGSGNVVSGDFSTIDWGNDLYFVQVEMDPAGGNNYQLMGTSQLLSVPYALHAASATNVDDADADPANELQTLTQVGSDVTLSDGGGTISINDADSDSTNELQTISKAGNIIALSNNGGTVIDSVDDADNDPVNEIQDLQIAGNDLSITNNGAATTIDLSPYLDNTDAQTLSNNVAGTVNTVDISGGNSINIDVADLDNDASNEIQDLQITGNDLSITNNGAATTIDLSGYLDNTDAQTLSVAGSDLTISNGNTVTLPSNLDNDSTNEIQDLQLTGDDLSITNNASATNIDLSSYANDWVRTSNNLSYNTGLVSLGSTAPNRKFLVVDTVTDSRIASIGFVTRSTGTSGVGRYIGLIGEVNGTTGTVRGAEIGSIGTGSTANQGGYFYAQNGGENYGVLGVALASSGASQNIGVRGITESGGAFNYGILGEANTNAGAGNFATGSFGWAIGNGAGDNYGIEGYTGGSSGTNYGIYADAVSFAGGGGTHYAGFFAGNVQISGNLDITGTISKGAGTFKIDHPLDPENKYLVHSFVESPDMMNVYNGNVVTDGNGMAVVELPDYVEAANKDFRYQLTVVGQFAQAIVKEKVSNNRFVIQTDQPNVEVSWQVTGIRNDPYAQKNRIQAEPVKEGDDRGKYLHPEAYGKSQQQSIFHKDLPSERKKQDMLNMKSQR